MLKRRRDTRSLRRRVNAPNGRDGLQKKRELQNGLRKSSRRRRVCWSRVGRVKRSRIMSRRCRAMNRQRSALRGYVGKHCCRRPKITLMPPGSSCWRHGSEVKDYRSGQKRVGRRHTNGKRRPSKPIKRSATSKPAKFTSRQDKSTNRPNEKRSVNGYNRRHCKPNSR